jgi:MYXO-CTERM domain-containing protein
MKYLVGFALSALLVPAVADAHITMTSPTPRYGPAYIKNGPCGKGIALDARTTNVTRFKPGQKITVTWNETVPHPGHYRIAFDPDGQRFTDPSAPDDVAPRMYVLVDNIADKTGTQSYSQDVTLPNITCTNCTLQLMQIMTDKQANGWGNDDFYYQCADLVLESDADMAPGPVDMRPTSPADLEPDPDPGRDLSAAPPMGMTTSGCSVAAAGAPGAAGALLLALPLLLLLRRRRRAG